MPKISAPTVKEHRQAVLTKLVDAAEGILRADRSAVLTAGAVSVQAGIARNSIYRYVDHVDDLRGLVLARYLPRWQRAVEARLSGVDDPRDRILEWVRANLEQADANGHGWLLEVARTTRIESGLQSDIEHAHTSRDFLASGLDDLGLAYKPVRAELIRSIVGGGFRLLDDGEGLDDVTDWVLLAVTAILD